MNQINAVTIGKLISAHREGDEEKFKAYVEFIADAYEQQGDDRAAIKREIAEYDMWEKKWRTT